MIVTGDDVVMYVSSRIGHSLQLPCTGIGISRHGVIIQGVVFNSWTGPDVEITVATDHRGLSRELLRVCASYAWGALACVRVTVTTEQKHVVKLAARLGAKVEGVKRSAYGPGRDGTVLGILKEEWLFHEKP